VPTVPHAPPGDLLNTVGKPVPAKASLHNPVEIDLVRLAMARANLSHKEFAYLMGQTPAQTTRQLNGQEALPFGRMRAKLPPVFWRELVILLAPLCGFSVERTLLLKEVA